MSTEGEKVQGQQSGYFLERVYSTKMTFESLAVSDDMPEGQQVPITLGWDWRILGERCFEVLLRVDTAPIRKRPERAEAAVIGQFRLHGEIQSIDLFRFVGTNAPAILFPYAREAISGLTGRGVFGALQLDPLNILELMKGFDQSKTTAARQLQEKPELASALHGEAPRALQASE